jgi:RHS repeat-associated protein
VDTSGGTPTTSQVVVAAYQYDFMGRRISKTVGSTTTYFIYDGWNLVAEYGAGQSTPSRTYTWGLDLSGTLQGAGGVGGLLAATIGSATYYPTYDGNGNISEYFDSNNVIRAHYEYDPFGNLTVSSGDKAADFAHRFSTKYLDGETGLYYYGFRYMDPQTGRWMSRDPIGERGGANLYGFCRNDGVTQVDLIGLKRDCSCCDDPKIVEKGLNALNAIYNKIRQKSNDAHVKLGGGYPSCKECASLVYREFIPGPACWDCRVEVRRMFKHVVQWDHAVVVCTALDTECKHTGDKIVYDLWGNKSPALPYRKFKSKYPYYDDDPDENNTSWGSMISNDCRKHYPKTPSAIDDFIKRYAMRDPTPAGVPIGLPGCDKWPMR